MVRQVIQPAVQQLQLKVQPEQQEVQQEQQIVQPQPQWVRLHYNSKGHFNKPEMPFFENVNKLGLEVQELIYKVFKYL
jgi:hypothetical protein